MPSVTFDWLSDPADVVAPRLLGCELTAHGVRVRLTEVEAYSGQGDDPASHAHRGPTPRNAVMFGPAGYAYVYFVFGMHWCLNISCGPDGLASAVLLRAGEVVAGEELARARRGAATPHRDLARGPARLASALGIDRAANGTGMIDGSGPLRLEPSRGEAGDISCGPRVGVAAAHDVPWRFWLTGDPTVSPYRRHTPRVRGGSGAKSLPAVREDHARDGHHR